MPRTSVEYNQQWYGAVSVRLKGHRFADRDYVPRYPASITRYPGPVHSSAGSAAPRPRRAVGSRLR